MSQVLHLFQLQKIDTELDRSSHRLKEITTIFQNDHQLLEAEQNLSKARSQMHRAHQELRAAEENVSAQRIKIEISESNLYSGKIKNPKELQDLQHEIISLKKYLLVLEDLQLEAMLKSEQAEEIYKKMESELPHVQVSVSSRHAGLMGEKGTLERQQERLGVERQVCQNQLLPENLAIYTHLREQKRGLAVAPIEDGSCQACGSSLRPAELQSAKSPNKIMYCSSCGRIIYTG